MKSKASRLFATLCLGAVTVSSAFAQITLYSDDFTGGTNGSLNTQPPQVRPGTETWRTGSTNKNTADGGSVTGTGEMAAYLPMPAIEAGKIYTLTARVFNNFADTTTSWIAIGWTAQTSSSTPSQGWNRANTGAYWMMWRGNNEIRGWQGLGAVNPIGVTGVNTPGVGNVLDMRVILDTRTGFNTVTFLYKNPDASAWTTYASASLDPTTINNIKSVGFSTVTGSSAGLQSFELTVESGAPSDPFFVWAGQGVLFNEDANGDGVSNGLAFLLGAEGPNAHVTLPTVSESGCGLTLGFSMRNATARGEVELYQEHSSDVGLGDDWVAVPVPDETPEPQAGDIVFTVTPGHPLNVVTATIQADQAVGGKLFGRLKAVKP